MIYELREYVAVAGKAEQLHERFAQHTFALFAEHGLELRGFWSDVEEPTRVVYLLRFPDEPTRQQAWAAFQDDPTWQSVKAESEAAGPIVAEMTSRTLHTPPYASGWTRGGMV